MPDLSQLDSARLQCLGRGSLTGTNPLAIDRFEAAYLGRTSAVPTQLPPQAETRSIQTMTGADGLQFVLQTDAAEQRLWARDEKSDQNWRPMELAQEMTGPGQRISQMACFNQHLYLAIDDSVRGFSLWQQPLRGDANEWRQLLKDGAYDYSNNAHVTALFAEGDTLLIATRAEERLLKLKTRPVGPELIAIDSEGNWDLLMGTTRPSDEGLVVPAAGMGRGFDLHGVSQISALGKTPAGYLAAIALPPGQHKQPCQLWQSADLVSWQPLAVATPWGENARVVRMVHGPEGLLLYLQGLEAEGSTMADAPVLDELPAGIELWLLRD